MTELTAGRAPAVVLRGVAKSYDGKRDAIAEMSLEVGHGEFVVLLGPSGSGKSTIVRAIAGIERIDRGSIEIFGRQVAGDRLHVAPEDRGVSMVFQDYALWPHMTVLDNVAFALKRAKVGSRDRKEKASEMLARVGLGGKEGRYPGELSGGEQQRVALARALVGHSGLVLFDEPLSNLDADLREKLRLEIATLTRETNASVIYITHDQAEAFALADKIGVLAGGRLIQMGEPEDIYQRPVNPFIARFTGLAGELAGKVLANPAPGLVEVEVPSASAVLRARMVGRLEPGDMATVALRPFALAISDADEPSIEARVLDVAFRGRGYEHALALGGNVISSVFCAERHPRGSKVSISVDPAGCLAFSEAEEVAVAAVHDPAADGAEDEAIAFDLTEYAL
ncbi:MAG: ABC transporter ATP-binding protein [Actinomycetota bacterium]|nr:ABC transporter ATP-binding protein [Actinomycetota bacterium]